MMGRRLNKRILRSVVWGLTLLLAPPVTAHSAPSATDQLLEVDRIELTGITAISNDEVQSAMEVFPGQRAERALLVRTVEGLLTLYRNHGFEKASIETRYRRQNGSGVLEFAVSEGLPTRASDVEFFADTIKDESSAAFWRKIEPTLREKVGIRPGDIIEQNKINNSRRVIEDLLASEEYVGAKVQELDSADAIKPVDTTVPAERWVKLRFKIKLGDRITFGFRGNTVLSRADLSALVNEQRLIGLGQDYVVAIRVRIEEEYRSRGYNDVRVETFTQDRLERAERHVTYVVREGDISKIASITFDGNQYFTNDQLIEQFDRVGSPLVVQRVYAEKDVAKATELVIEWLKSQGYLAAKQVTIRRERLPRLRPSDHFQSIALVIYIYEGDQTTVGNIRVLGSEVFKLDEVRTVIGQHEGRPLNLFALISGIEQLKVAYRNRGYLDVEIQNEGSDHLVKYTQDNRIADIELQIADGVQYRISKIVVDGLLQTKEYVVRRELPIKEGDIVDESLLGATDLTLRRLGIFSSILIKTAPDGRTPDGKIIRIVVQEATPGIVAGGIGYRNDLGPRVFGQLGYTNLWGRNHTALLTTTVNRRIENYHLMEYTAQLAYIAPWSLLGPTTLRPTLTASAVQYIQFAAASVAAAVTLERTLIKSSNLVGLLTYSIERTRQFNAKDALDEQAFRIGQISPQLRLDLRNNSLVPTQGFFGQLIYDYSDPIFGSQREPFPIGYSRVQMRSDFYWTLFGKMNWYFSFRTGFERSNQEPVKDASGNEIKASGAIPLIKQFALGGVATLRGFQEQQLNLYDRLLRGTASYVNYRLQFDVPMSGALRFGPFLDAANLVSDQYTLTDQMRFGSGFSFRFLSPLGPVNLDWGFNLAPKAGEDRDRIHFSIGVL